MTPETFRSIHEASGLNAAQLARFLRIEDARSIRRYRSGETAVSGPVSKLMDQLAQGYHGLELAILKGQSVNCRLATGGSNE